MRLLADAIEHPVAPKLRPVFRIPPHGIVERESTAVYPVDPPFLAKAVGASSSTLRAAFRKVLGTSLGKYALSVRMREARRLMTEDRLSVKEVAARTGFSSQAYFCYAYRAIYGRPRQAIAPSTNNHAFSALRQPVTVNAPEDQIAPSA